METAANDLLENGIYVETNRGLVCMSLKDALTSGVGGLKLSVEDLQNIALLLTQHQEIAPQNESLSVEESGPEQSGQSDTCVVEASSQETDSGKETDTCVAPPPILVPQKRRGGWPKGRKRKPEDSETRPPKAPATGYVLYLNENRKFYKDIPFTEVTKLLGGEWSRLSIDEKQRFMDQAEEDKKRYRRELKTYRQSSAYQEFLRKKRHKRLNGNRTEESDMDATDEIEDDEDNEELYCRRCDQWFSSLHNKKEHLFGRTHMQAMANDPMKERRMEAITPASTSLDESSLDGCPATSSYSSSSSKARAPATVTVPEVLSDVSTSMSQLLDSCAAREKEIHYLKSQMESAQTLKCNIAKEIALLRERELQLTQQRIWEQQETAKLNGSLRTLTTLCYVLDPTSHFNMDS